MKTLMQLLAEGEDMVSSEDSELFARLLRDVTTLTDNYLARTKHYTETEQGRAAVLFVFELISRLPRGKQQHALSYLLELANKCEQVLLREIAVGVVSDVVDHVRRGLANK